MVHLCCRYVANHDKLYRSIIKMSELLRLHRLRNKRLPPQCGVLFFSFISLTASLICFGLTGPLSPHCSFISRAKKELGCHYCHWSKNIWQILCVISIRSMQLIEKGKGVPSSFQWKQDPCSVILLFRQSKKPWYCNCNLQAESQAQDQIKFDKLSWISHTFICSVTYPAQQSLPHKL